jgi:hypothetical protein
MTLPFLYGAIFGMAIGSVLTCIYIRRQIIKSR